MLKVRTPGWSAAIAALMVVAVGCSSGGGSDASVPPVTKVAGSHPLVHTHWTLSETSNLGVSLTGVSVNAEFADGRVTGTSGCNGYNAAYTTSGGRQMAIGPEIASTQIACAAGPTAVEQAYLAALRKVAGYKIDAAKLTLSDAAGTALLVYTTPEGTDAIAGKWTVTTYYSGTAVQSVVNGSTLTADFADGRVSGNSGCNTYSGPYEVTGTAITMGPFISTRVACPSPELAAQEQHYLEALSLARTFRITGDSLGLLRDDGGVAATFTKT